MLLVHLVLAAVAAVLLGVAAWLNRRLGFYDDVRGLEYLVVLVTVVHLVQPPLAQVALSLGRYRVFNLGMLLPMAVATAGIVVLRLAGALDAEGSLLVLVGGMGLAAVVLLGAVPEGWRGDRARERFRFREQAGIAVRGYLTGLFNLAITRADILLVAALTRDLGAAGVYSVGVFMAELVLRLPQWSGQLLAPLVAAGDTAARQRTVTLLWANGLAVVGYLVVAALVLPVGEQLLAAIIGPDFVASYWVMLGLGPRILMQSAITVLQGNLAGRAYPVAVPVGQGLALACVVIADLVLIPAYGIFGAVAGGALGYLPCLLVVFRGFLRAEGLTLAEFAGLSRASAIAVRNRVRVGAGRPA